MTITLSYQPLPTPWVRAVQAGGPDANGQLPERAISEGEGTPCRHCLRNVPRGAEMLVLAARPFSHLQPYAETGPIFLCAAECAPWQGAGRPPILGSSETYLMRGYDAGERIVYGTGRIERRDRLEAGATDLLRDPAIAYIHVRSSSNNCYLARIARQEGADDIHCRE